MEARTSPFTRMTALAMAYRAERDLLASLDRGDAAGRRVTDRLLRALGVEQPGAAHQSVRPAEPVA